MSGRLLLVGGDAIGLARLATIRRDVPGVGRVVIADVGDAVEVTYWRPYPPLKLELQKILKGDPPPRNRHERRARARGPR